MTVKMLASDINGYTEIGQDTDVKFAPIGVDDGKFYQTHPWFKCKDYFNEVIAAKKLGQSFKEYGFEFDPKEHELPEDTHILIKTSKFDNIIKGIEKYLHPVETEAGLKLTEWEKLSEGIYHIHGDSIYMDEPVFMSAYTLMLRNFWYSEYADGEDMAGYLKDLYDNDYTRGTQVLVLKSMENFDVIRLLLINMKVLSIGNDAFYKRMSAQGANFLHNSTGFNSTIQWLRNYNAVSYKIQGSTSSHYAEPFFKTYYPKQVEMAALLGIKEVTEDELRDIR